VEDHRTCHGRLLLVVVAHRRSSLARSIVRRRTPRTQAQQKLVEVRGWDGVGDAVARARLYIGKRGEQVGIDTDKDLVYFDVIIGRENRKHADSRRHRAPAGRPRSRRLLAQVWL
jgi:hypothetical protein